VEALCGDEVEISRVFWSFALLRHEHLREYAVKEAARAEMIVVSLRAGSDLPAHVKSWLESLPIRAEAGQAALVVLIGHKSGTWAERHSQIAHLREIAERRGLDFLCNQDGWERLDVSEPALRLVEDKTPTLENILSCHIPWSSGGIND
jgi:hypothetical protein